MKDGRTEASFTMPRKHECYTMCLDGRFMGWLIGHRPGGPQHTKGILGEVGILEFSPSSTVL